MTKNVPCPNCGGAASIDEQGRLYCHDKLSCNFNPQDHKNTFSADRDKTTTAEPTGNRISNARQLAGAGYLGDYKEKNGHFVFDGCPYCGDNREHFYMNAESGAHDCKKCFEAGSLNKLLNFIGLQGQKPESKVVATFDYVDEAGQLLFQVYRFDPKKFAQRRPDGRWGLGNNGEVRRVVYRLPELIPALYAFLVEGEGCVEVLRELGVTATCNPLGAGNWRPEYNPPLSGKNIIGLPDNDRKGRDHFIKILPELVPIAASIKILELPGLPEKGDIVNWVKAHRTQGLSNEQIKAELLRLAGQAGDGADWLNKQSAEGQPDLSKALMRIRDIRGLEIEQRYVCNKIIPEQSITLFSGAGCVGGSVCSVRL
ncbi:MAG: hypothetical protein HQK96_20235 [Nitrospirae bacterium]|nr:hypothetical protein [Nitrospirota bacterium]